MEVGRLTDPLGSLIAMLEKRLLEWSDKSHSNYHTPYLQRLFPQSAIKDLQNHLDTIFSCEFQRFIALLSTFVIPTAVDRAMTQEEGIRVHSDSMLKMATKIIANQT